MPGLQLQHHLDRDGVAVVWLSGDLDGSSAAAYREKILACCAAARAVVLDGAQVRSCDPVALELLVTAQQLVTSAGGRFAIAGPSFALGKALRTTGLASAFTITSTVRAAHATGTSGAPESRITGRENDDAVDRGIG